MAGEKHCLVKMLFVITALGSGTFKRTSKPGQSPILMGSWARGRAPWVTDGGVLELTGAVLTP